MLMKRRTPPGWLEFLRVWIWPRRSWLRSGQYVTKRILRITATPHAIAAGVASGAFTSFTPFMGLHFLIAFILAWCLRGNLIASALGTFIGNPLTFPFIWAATYETGHFVLQTRSVHEETPSLVVATADVLSSMASFDWSGTVDALSAIWFPVLYPMLIGGLVVGPVVSIPLYFLVRRGALLFREARRNKLMAKAKALRDRAKNLAEKRQSSGMETSS